MVETGCHDSKDRNKSFCVLTHFVAFRVCVPDTVFFLIYVIISVIFFPGFATCICAIMSKTSTLPTVKQQNPGAPPIQTGPCHGKLHNDKDKKHCMYLTFNT